MGRNRWWFGVVMVPTIALLWVGQVLGQAPLPPELSPVPGSPTPTLSPSPTTSPTLAPPPPSTAAPLSLSGDYRDPGGRFKVGILQGYTFSPLSGAVLVESLNGNLSYTVVWQSQVLTDLVGFDLLLVNDRLAQVARTIFQRGEGFQPGLVQPVAPEGVQMSWQGSLTIAGQSQPISGVILAKPSGSNGLFLLIAATQKGVDQVPGAISALWKACKPYSSFNDGNGLLPSPYFQDLFSPMNPEFEIRRLLDVLPASGRMMTKLVSKPEQSVVIDFPFPVPWTRERPIWINFDLWSRLSPAQRDLLILRTSSWVSGVKWFKPNFNQGLVAAGLLGAIVELTQVDLVGVAVAGGLMAIASTQIWRNNKNPRKELDADESAIQVALRRGYSETDAARHLLSAIEAVAEIEGRPSLNFNELIRCQNLRSISGISPVGVPPSMKRG